MQMNVSMLTKGLVGTGVLSCLFVGQLVRADTLNFDDQPEPPASPTAITFLPNPYHGFTAHEVGFPGSLGSSPSPLAIESDADYEGPDSTYGNSYGAPSAPNAVTNNRGDGVVLTSSTPFLFSSVAVSAFANGDFGTNTTGQVYPIDSARTLTVSGSLAGVPVVVLNPSVALSDTGYTTFTPVFAGLVDSITFTGSGSDEDGDPTDYPNPNDFFLLDNFTYNLPEPASLGLLGVGCMMFASRRRRSCQVR